MTSYADRYFYPGTTVFINNFGEKDPAELARKEAFYSRLALRNPVPGGLDFQTIDGFKRLHEHMLGLIYPWAGEFRSVDMDKVLEDGGQVRFLTGPYVMKRMADLCRDYRVDVIENPQWKSLSNSDLAFRCAVYMADLNEIHPFPEGNGRIQRMFLADMIAQAGHALDYAAFTDENWLEASIDSFGQILYDRHGHVSDIGRHAKMSALIKTAIK